MLWNSCKTQCGKYDNCTISDVIKSNKTGSEEVVIIEAKLFLHSASWDNPVIGKKCLAGSLEVVVDENSRSDNELEQPLCYAVTDWCLCHSLVTLPLLSDWLLCLLLCYFQWLWSKQVQFCRSNLVPGPVWVMADHLPPVLLEACVVVGASNDKLREISQVFAAEYLIHHSILLGCYPTEDPR